MKKKNLSNVYTQTSNETPEPPTFIGKRLVSLMMHTGITIERNCYTSLNAQKHGLTLTLIDCLHVEVVHVGTGKRYLVYNTNCFNAEFE